MKEIPLTQGQVAIVDDEDYEWLMQWSWYASYDKDTNSYRAVRSVYLGGGRGNNYGSVKMSREIAKTPRGMVCDHINHDTLDNRKHNLRNSTRQQNCFNKLYKKSLSGFRGVHKNGNKWQARLMHNGKHISAGIFDNPVDAARAYDAKARELFGEFAITNF